MRRLRVIPHSAADFLGEDNMRRFFVCILAKLGFAVFVITTAAMLIPVATAGDKRSPTFWCTECGGPNGGLYTDPKGGALCKYCFKKLYPQGGTFNESTGTFVPKESGVLSCMKGCHQDG